MLSKRNIHKVEKRTDPLKDIPLGRTIEGKPVVGTQAEILRRQAQLHLTITSARNRAEAYRKHQGQIRAFFPIEAQRADLLRSIAHHEKISLPEGRILSEAELLQIIFKGAISAKGKPTTQNPKPTQGELF